MAQFNYGQLVMMKASGKAGVDQAFPWFEKAAAAKLPDAEYAISQVYANGTDKIAKDDKRRGNICFLQRARATILRNMI